MILDGNSQGLRTNGAFRAHYLQAKRKAEEFEVCSYNLCQKMCVSHESNPTICFLILMDI